MSGESIACIVVAFNGGRLLESCVAALRASRLTAPRIVVVDNASDDGSVESLARTYGDSIELVRSRRNLGFAGGVNAGMCRLEARADRRDDDVYVLVNQDCIVASSAIARLAALLRADARVGVAGARLLEPDGRTLQHAGGLVHANGLTAHLGRGAVDADAYGERAEVEYVTGALCAFRASTWARFGPLDETFYPAYYEDLDFCLRVRDGGLSCVYEPGSSAVHHESSSTGRESRVFLQYYHRNRMRFLARHWDRYGGLGSVLYAELAWLGKQRRLADLGPVFGAYARLAYDLCVDRARAGRRIRWPDRARAGRRAR